MKAINLAGRVFGRLQVVSRAGSTNRTPARPLWLCRCACGADRIVLAASLLAGRTRSCGCLRDAILASLPKIGEPVIEPALRAYAEADDHAFRVNVGSILARIGVLDDRIFAVLLEMLEISPSRAGDLAQYGDDRALPYLSRAFDADTLRDSDSPFAHQDLVELQAVPPRCRREHRTQQ